MSASTLLASSHCEKDGSVTRIRRASRNRDQRSARRTNLIVRSNSSANASIGFRQVSVTRSALTTPAPSEDSIARSSSVATSRRPQKMNRPSPLRASSTIWTRSSGPSSSRGATPGSPKLSKALYETAMMRGKPSPTGDILPSLSKVPVSRFATEPCATRARRASSVLLPEPFLPISAMILPGRELFRESQSLESIDTREKSNSIGSRQPNG